MVKCPFCSLIVRDNCRAIECDCCAKWLHLKCTNMSLKAYKSLTLSNDLWLCQACRNSIFPFNNLDDSELLKFSFNSNTSCICSKNIAIANLQDMPLFDIISSLSNVPLLSSSDPEENLPSQINSKYYTLHEFHKSKEIHSYFSNNSLSVLHCNIRSISANFDHLVDMLSELQHPFKLIGLSETWINSANDLTCNVSLPGYKFLSQPSSHRAGGVGLFVNEDLCFNIREDLSSSDEQFESLWIELQNPSSKNVLCAVVYRHPNTDLESFLNSFF